MYTFIFLLHAAFTRECGDNPLSAVASVVKASA
jgi:hypothetical protein